jgi:hypothetical protein
VASGVRADLALNDPEALAAYTGEFTGGQLKVAPEHCAARVLDLMRKPGMEVFEAFLQSFVEQSRLAGREQYVVPYMMSAFPGCRNATGARSRPSASSPRRAASPRPCITAAATRTARRSMWPAAMPTVCASTAS